MGGGFGWLGLRNQFYQFLMNFIPHTLNHNVVIADFLLMVIVI